MSDEKPIIEMDFQEGLRSVADAQGRIIKARRKAWGLGAVSAVLGVPLGGALEEGPGPRSTREIESEKLRLEKAIQARKDELREEQEDPDSEKNKREKKRLAAYEKADEKTQTSWDNALKLVMGKYKIDQQTQQNIVTQRMQSMRREEKEARALALARAGKARGDAGARLGKPPRGDISFAQGFIQPALQGGDFYESLRDRFRQAAADGPDAVLALKKEADSYAEDGKRGSFGNILAEEGGTVVEEINDMISAARLESKVLDVEEKEFWENEWKRSEQWFESQGVGRSKMSAIIEEAKEIQKADLGEQDPQDYIKSQVKRYSTGGEVGEGEEGVEDEETEKLDLEKLYKEDPVIARQVRMLDILADETIQDEPAVNLRSELVKTDLFQQLMDNLKGAEKLSDSEKEKIVWKMAAKKRREQASGRRGMSERARDVLKKNLDPEVKDKERPSPGAGMNVLPTEDETEALKETLQPTDAENITEAGEELEADAPTASTEEVVEAKDDTKSPPPLKKTKDPDGASLDPSAFNALPAVEGMSQIAGQQGKKPDTSRIQGRLRDMYKGRGRRKFLPGEEEDQKGVA